MNKLPVGETISGAYGFAFAGFLTVLGTVWLPYLVLFALDAGAVYLIAPDLPTRVVHGDIDMSLVYSWQRVRPLIFIVNFIIGSMIAVGLQQRALGQVQGPTFFYFSLGAPVWRMIGATFLALVAYVFIMVLTVAATAALVLAAIKFVAHFGVAIGVIVGILASCWLIYAGARLFFFLPAVVVAEEQIGLVRAWELGGGNFWRIFAVAFVVFVPFWIGFYIVWGAVIGPFIPWDLFSHVHSGMTPDQANDLSFAIIKRMLQEVRVALPVFLTLFVIQQLLTLGLANGMIAKGYLGVTGKG